MNGGDQPDHHEDEQSRDRAASSVVSWKLSDSTAWYLTYADSFPFTSRTISGQRKPSAT